MKTTTTELLEQNQRLGTKLDTATDPAAMKFLITARKSLRTELERRNEQTGPAKQQWFGLTLHRTGEVSFT
jgi:hypothetical protein